MCMNFDRVCRWNNFVRVRKRDSEGNIPSKPGKIYTVTSTKEDDNGDIIQYQGRSKIGIEGVDTYKVTGLSLQGCRTQKMLAIASREQLALSTAMRYMKSTNLLLIVNTELRLLEKVILRRHWVRVRRVDHQRQEDASGFVT